MGRFHQIKKLLLGTAGIAFGVMLLRGCVGTSYSIPSTGMENALYKGERILVNKWSYGLRLPLMSLVGYHRWGRCVVGKQEVMVFNNPANYTESTISGREQYIGRCIGLPGDTLYVDPHFAEVYARKNSPDSKTLYCYPSAQEQQMDSLLGVLSLLPNELMGQDSAMCVRSFSRYEFYLLQQAIAGKCWIEPVLASDSLSTLIPFVVPAKGSTLQVNTANCALLCNTLLLHEHRRAEVRNDTLWLEGKPVQQCSFTKNYYWVSANNTVNLTDSRRFGFVPEDHIIGRAEWIWYSQDKNRIWTKIK